MFLEADFVGFVDNPKLPGTRWKRLLNNPEECGRASVKYRNLLPVKDNELIDDTDTEVTGLYFKHGLIALRVFNMCCFCVILAMGIALYLAKIADAATGFTVGAFILAAISLFLAVLAIVVASTR